jgi:hypothetical protein
MNSLDWRMNNDGTGVLTNNCDLRFGAACAKGAKRLVEEIRPSRVRLRLRDRPRPIELFELQ